MNKTVLIFFLSLAWTSFLQAAAPTTSQPSEDQLNIPEGTLTISEARRITLADNPTVKEALQRIQSAQAVVRQAKSSWLPTISAQAGYRAIDGNIQPDWSPTTRLKESYNEASVGIQMSWLVFDGFAREANILASKYGVNQSEEILYDTQRLLLQAVSTAYYQAQLAVETMVIAQQNQSFNRRLEEDARKKWLAGSVPEADMLNFSVRALQAEADFLNADRNFKITGTVLAELMALPNAKLTRAMYPKRGETSLVEAMPVYDCEIGFALRNRPDLKALDAGIESGRQRLRAQKGSYVPQVALVAGVDYLNQKGTGHINQDEHVTFVGLVAQWDLFTGGRRLAKTEEISSEIRTLYEQRKRIVLSIESSIRQSLDNARIAYEIHKRQQAAYKLTTRIRSHVEKAYRAGTTSLTRLNQAQTDLVRASGQVATSSIRYQIALMNLEADTGRILWDMPTSQER